MAHGSRYPTPGVALHLISQRTNPPCSTDSVDFFYSPGFGGAAAVVAAVVAFVVAELRRRTDKQEK